MYSTIPDYEIFKKLKSEGVLGGLWMFNRGSLLDFSGNGNDVAPTNATLNDTGVSGAIDGYLQAADSPTLQATNQSWVFRIPNKKPSTAAIALFYKRDVGGVQLYGYFNSTLAEFSLYDGTTLSTVSLNFKAYDVVGVSVLASGVPLLYVNGLASDAAFDASLSVGTNDAPLTLLNRNTYDREFTGNVSNALFASKVLTATEHSQIYAAFSEMARLERFPTQYKCLPSIDPNPSEDGLVLGCNMRPVGSVLPNLGTGDNGAITGARHGKDALGDFLYFDGDSSLVNFGTDPLNGVLDNFLISVWFKQSELATTKCLVGRSGETPTRQFLLYIDTANTVFFLTAAGSVRSTSFFAVDEYVHVAFALKAGVGYLYINGVLEDSSPMTLTSHPTMPLMLGAEGDGTVNRYFLKGKMYAPKILTTLPSDPATYAKREYKKGLYALVQAGYGARESVATVSAGYIENTNIELLTGGVKIIGEFDADNNHLKIIEAQSASTIKFPLTNLGDEDENRWAWYDDGSGYVWTELSTTNRVLTMASGDKLIYSSLRGNSSMIKRLLA